MVPSITAIARTTSIPPWMRSEPWAGIFNNPSIAFVDCDQELTLYLNYVGKCYFRTLICFRYYLSNLVCNNFISYSNDGTVSVNFM